MQERFAFSPYVHSLQFLLYDTNYKPLYFITFLFWGRSNRIAECIKNQKESNESIRLTIKFSFKLKKAKKYQLTNKAKKERGEKNAAVLAKWKD